MWYKSSDIVQTAIGNTAREGTMSEKKPRLRGMATMSSVGIQLVVSTVIGLFLGLWLDKKFDTAPWLMLLGLVIGIASGFKNLYEVAKRYGFDDDKE